MPSGRNRFQRYVRIVASLAMLVAGCNDVIGIEEPSELGDASIDIPFEVSSDRGTAREQPTESGSPTTPDAPPSEGGAPTTPDGRMESGVPGTPDAPSMPDTAVIRDTGAAEGGRGGAGGAGPADGSGMPAIDVRDAGIAVSPGTASATCQFSEISGTSIDSSMFETTAGEATRRIDGGSEYLQLYVMNFIRGVQRTLIIRLSVAPVAGRTLSLDDANYVEYYEVKTGSGWSSAKAPTRGGSIRIDDANGTSFSFTIIGAKLGPALMSAGTFTLNGSGSANPL
jgi:hypothetical protein